MSLGNAGVAQSVVSSYESGRRNPSIRTLAKLVGATGHRLIVDIERQDDGARGLPDSPLGRRLRQHRRAVVACARRHSASNVRVFWSVARGEDGPDSDIDLVVDLAPGTGLFELGALRRELSDILHARVDVAPSASLRASVREEVERDAVPL
ncbi:MAG: nucleotidyltransferase domain-containing protein [Acidimicrobiales bacterium]